MCYYMEAVRATERRKLTKLCVVCGKPLTGKQRKTCSVECRRERRKKYIHEYRQNNLERERKRNRKYQQNNSEKRKEYRRKYYQDNLEKMRKYRRKYRQNNLEKMRESSRNRYQDNLEKERERGRERRRNNRGKERERGHKYYRRTRGLPEDWDLSQPSSIEIMVKQWLQDSDIEFTEQQYINLRTFGANWTRVDFFIEPNICVYCDGDYWHGLENPDVQECDVRINRALEEKGHVVIRLTESDILAGVRPVEILELIQ